MHDLRPTQTRSGSLGEGGESGVARLDDLAVLDPPLGDEAVGVFEVPRIAMESKVGYSDFGLRLLVLAKLYSGAPRVGQAHSGGELPVMECKRLVGWHDLSWDKARVRREDSQAFFDDCSKVRQMLGVLVVDLVDGLEPGSDLVGKSIVRPLVAHQMPKNGQERG